MWSSAQSSEALTCNSVHKCENATGCLNVQFVGFGSASCHKSSADKMHKHKQYTNIYAAQQSVDAQGGS